nr:reverse transcriptase domain-containing protein [Tanacetum cinerariifolium]
MDQSIKRPPAEDDECYVIDDLDDTINAETQELLTNDKSDSFLLKGLEKSINQSDLESCECFKTRPDEVKSGHLYSASANKIDEKKPKLNNFPHHLEYAYLHGDKSFPIIISTKLSEKEKMVLLQDGECASIIVNLMMQFERIISLFPLLIKDRLLARYEETNLVLNWEICYFMVKKGIVLAHKTSGASIEVDGAKINVIAKFPYPTNVKGVRSFLGHAGFYRRRTRVDPNLLNDFDMATNRNGDDIPHAGGGDLPVPDLRTMEELCQTTLNGRVQNSCQFHGLLGDDATKHLDKFLHVTQSIKVNGVTDDALRLYLFPHSLTDLATTWFDRFPRNSITTFKQMDKMFLGKYFPPYMVTKLRNEITNFHQCPDELLFEAWKRYKLSIDRCPNHNMLPVTQIDTFYNGLTLRHRDTINAAADGTFMKRHPEECYDLIENMTAHHNDWDTSIQRSESSSSITSSSDLKIVALKAEMAEINKI